MKRKPKLPSHEQMRWLTRIAHSRLMKTYEHGVPHYTLQNGTAVPEHIAELLIYNGWLNRLGDSLYPDENSQTYEVLKP